VNVDISCLGCGDMLRENWTARNLRPLIGQFTLLVVVKTRSRCRWIQIITFYLWLLVFVSWSFYRYLNTRKKLVTAYYLHTIRPISTGSKITTFSPTNRGIEWNGHRQELTQMHTNTVKIRREFLNRWSVELMGLKIHSSLRHPVNV